MLKLIYYVPESHLETTKAAVFAAGAGCFDNYRDCAWQVKGTGQFMPVRHAQPHLGNLNVLEQTEEWRVETIVPEHAAAQVKQALLDSHPYEVPAFEFLAISDI